VESLHVSATDFNDFILDPPKDWWHSARIASSLSELFRSYIIGLLLGGIVEGRYQIDFYTGFLLYHADNLIWITAGHVVDKVGAVLASRSFRLSIMRWVDGYEVPGGEAVQVHHVPPPMKSWKEQGFDIGAVKLEGLDAWGLLANQKLRVMHEQGWKNLENAKPEGYFIVGYPSVWSAFSETPVEGNKVLRSIRTDLACIPVSPITEPSSPDRFPNFWARTHSFFAQIITYSDLPDFEVEELAGMSGSPVISIERTSDAQLRYRLVGVLAEWLPGEKIIRAEPMRYVADAISSW
jgi:hypothetical protein